MITQMVTPEKCQKWKWTQKREKKEEEELPGNFSNFSLFPFLSFSSSFSSFLPLLLYIFLFRYANSIPGATLHSTTVSPSPSQQHYFLSQFLSRPVKLCFHPTIPFQSPFTYTHCFLQLQFRHLRPFATRSINPMVTFNLSLRTKNRPHFPSHNNPPAYCQHSYWTV